MFCTHCGQQLGDEVQYCPACGANAKGGSADAPPRDYGAPKRLYRLRNDRKIAGICSGIAKHINADVTLVRIVTIAAVCVTGFLPGIVAYLVVWAIMPLEEPAVYGGERRVEV
ncbi:MAG: PspC domain-containing protein [Acidobacteria bacterium]|nr:PspC domain-containing protein [Acidobacteriota bacterium]